MNARENYLRAIEFRNPQWIPATASILPAAWMKYREDLERIVLCHPKIFGHYEKGNPCFWPTNPLPPIRGVPRLDSTLMCGNSSSCDRDANGSPGSLSYPCWWLFSVKIAFSDQKWGFQCRNGIFSVQTCHFQCKIPVWGPHDSAKLVVGCPIAAYSG